MRLRAEVVHLGRLHLRDDVHEVRAVGQVAVVQLELARAYNGWSEPVDDEKRAARRTLKLVLVQVVQTTGIEAGGSANDSVDLVALGQQQLRARAV